ncbi:hypothetical protein CCMA1212_005009 [Trichoderma ghanense]|uniref:Uncharacterized protein n=1 Tax=Trichoderma ghanense TaxID=65468 RepID=A0ABY2H2T4_9HYPO
MEGNRIDTDYDGPFVLQQNAGGEITGITSSADRYASPSRRNRKTRRAWKKDSWEDGVAGMDVLRAEEKRTKIHIPTVLPRRVSCRPSQVLHRQVGVIIDPDENDLFV